MKEQNCQQFTLLFILSFCLCLPSQLLFLIPYLLMGSWVVKGVLTESCYTQRQRWRSGSLLGLPKIKQLYVLQPIYALCSSLCSACITTGYHFSKTVSQQEQEKKRLALPCLAGRIERVSCGCSFPGSWRPELGQPQGTMGWAGPAQVCPGWSTSSLLTSATGLVFALTPEHCKNSWTLPGNAKETALGRQGGLGLLMPSLPEPLRPWTEDEDFGRGSEVLWPWGTCGHAGLWGGLS